jgi:hypothetical protein
MPKRAFEDFEIKNRVRAVLVKFWFDTSTLTISVHRGKVHVFGALCEKMHTVEAAALQRVKNDPFMEDGATGAAAPHESMHGKNSFKRIRNKVMEHTSRKLLLAEQEIYRIRGIRHVTLDFSNYKKSGGVWRQSR